METYYCKRYRRSAPGQITGAVTDEVKFSADGAAEAERVAKRGLLSVISHTDWERDFATLEDESGKIIVRWLDGGSYV
jgi:hypothetical protein